MDKAIFQEFCQIVYDTAGIKLTETKEALVSSRIGKRMRTLGIAEHQDYLKLIKEETTGNEIVHMIDAISTNVTSFYREAGHFTFLTELAQAWLAKGGKRWRLWCAAASTGEEPYTLAMTLNEVFEGRGVDWKVLATDISISVLERCRTAVYTAAKVEPVSPQLRQKYFTKQGSGESTVYAVKDSLKQHILFRRLNLATPPFSMNGPLDVVFVRNVMIYFDNTVRARLISEVERLLKPGGHLIVGHAESLNGLDSNLRTLSPSVYQRP